MPQAVLLGVKIAPEPSRPARWARYARRNRVSLTLAVAMVAAGVATRDYLTALGALLVGQNTGSAGANKGFANEKAEAWKFTASATGTVEEIEIITATGASTATTVKVAVMTDSAGVPGTIIGSEVSKVETPAENAAYKVPGLSAAVTSGTVYWLVMLPIGGLVKIKEGTTAGYSKSTAAVSEISKAAWTASENKGPVGIAGIGTVGGGVTIPLNAAASTSAASMAMTAPTRVPLEAAASSSAASAAVTAATQIPLQPAASSSAATADVLNPGPLVGTRAIPTANTLGVAAKRQWAWMAMATRSKTLNELHVRTQTAAEWGEGVEGTNWLAVYADDEYEPGLHRPGAVLGKVSIKNKPPLGGSFTVTGFSVALTAGTLYWIGGVSSVIARPIATEEGKGGTGPLTVLVTTKVTYTEPTATTEWQTSPASEGPLGMYGISGVTIDLAPASSSSSASLALTAATQIPLAAASSTSAASASVNAPTQVPLLAAASSSAASMKLTAPTQIPLNPASSTSAAQATVTVPAGPVTIPLNPASSSSSATLALTAATRVPLQPASSVSSAGELSISFPDKPEFAGGGGAALAIWTGGGSSPGPTVGSGGAMQAITATGGASS